MDLLSIIMLGLLQGIFEWLPVSSKTIDAFVFLQFFGGTTGQVLYVVLFLHIGTVLAAIIYFRDKLIKMGLDLLKIRNLNHLKGHEAMFYVSALFGTAIIALPLLILQKFILPSLNASTLFILMGAGLLVTSFLLSRRLGRITTRQEKDATPIDGLITGIFQGFSLIPGISRSGASTTALIWRKFDPFSAFELSFILSIPTVICGEIFFYILGGGFTGFDLTDGLLLATSSFIFGYLTIGYLLDAAKKIDLSKLALAFGILMVIAGFFKIG